MHEYLPYVNSKLTFTVSAYYKLHAYTKVAHFVGRTEKMKNVGVSIPCCEQHDVFILTRLVFSIY